MNAKKCLVLIFSLFMILVNTSNSQPYATSFGLSAADVVIPWNQQSATGVINITYYNYVSYVPSVMNAISFNGSNLDFDGTLPTQAQFTVSSPGDYTYAGLLFWYAAPYVIGGYITQSGSVHVTKQPTPLIAPRISNFSQSPDPVYNGGSGTVYVNLSQGTGDITYTWYCSNTPSNMTASFSPQGDHCGVQYYIPYNTRPSINFTCVVSNSAGTDVKSYQLNVAAYWPYTW